MVTYRHWVYARTGALMTNDTLRGTRASRFPVYHVHLCAHQHCNFRHPRPGVCLRESATAGLWTKRGLHLIAQYYEKFGLLSAEELCESRIDS